MLLDNESGQLAREKKKRKEKEREGHGLREIRSRKEKEQKRKMDFGNLAHSAGRNRKSFLFRKA